MLTNLFLAVPGLPLLIILSGCLQPGAATVIFVLTVISRDFAARIVRSQTLLLRSANPVPASRPRRVCSPA